MIIIDLNQIMLAPIMITGKSVSEDEFRHMVLNSLRMNRTKYKREYGELLLASDNHNYWRRTYFPYYKASRADTRSQSGLDWKQIFESMNKIKSELNEYFPYKVIDVEGAEADDIIGTLVRNLDENILIISSDKDFVQLHRPGVKQIDPIRKRNVSHPDPSQYLREHVLKGDPGDGIPNVLSADDCFVTKTRQTPLRQTKIDLILAGEMNEDVKRNYARNKMLIDLSQTPAELQERILTEVEIANVGKRNQLQSYFIKHRLKHLLSSIGEF